jgi:hypothetical protein
LPVQSRNLSRQLINALVEPAPVFGQTLDHAHHTLGQKYGYGISQITFGPNSIYFHGGEMPGYNSFMGHDPVNDVTDNMDEPDDSARRPADSQYHHAEDARPDLHGIATSVEARGRGVRCPRCVSRDVVPPASATAAWVR